MLQFSHMKRRLAPIILLFILAACNLPQPIPPASLPTAEMPAPPTSTIDPLTMGEVLPDLYTPTPTSSYPTPLLSPTPIPPAEPPIYVLDALFDYYAHTLTVTQTVTYTNNSPDPLASLVMFVEPNRYPGSFTLRSLAWVDRLDDGQLIADYSLSGNRMEIFLPQPLMPGQDVALQLRYNLALPAIPEPSDTTRPVPYGYTSRQTNLVDWYAFFPPYRSGEGWLWRQAGYFGEHQVYELAEYSVRIKLTQPVDDLKIAASDQNHYNLQSPLTYDYTHWGRNFVWSASQQYQALSQQVGNVTVVSYHFPYHDAGGEAVLQHTADALALYSEVYGPYPHSTLSVVEADFLDGMEYDGLYFLSRGFYDLYDGTPFGYLTIIAAHETAHQWWYGMVGNDQANEPWLDEALCTFSERLFYENVYPDLLFYSQPVLDWWQFYRIDYYQPSGWVNGAIYDYDSFLSYRNAVYLRGAEFLQALRQQMGDEAFFAFLQDYVVQKSYQTATAADFFAILEEHTDQDIRLLLAEYFKP